MNSQPHASNTEDKIKGKFLDTKVGMGHSDSMMGPELGCAYVLKDYATEENPIYFIKMCSSGSGFAQSGSSAEGKNWEVKTEDGTPVEHNLYVDFLKPFLQNNLDLIEEETGIETRTSVLGYLQRGGTPSPYDILLATKVGAAAADFLAEKRFGNLVGVKGGQIVGVPLSDVAGKAKGIPEDDPMLKTARELGICFGN